MLANVVPKAFHLPALFANDHEPPRLFATPTLFESEQGLLMCLAGFYGANHEERNVIAGGGNILCAFMAYRNGVEIGAEREMTDPKAFRSLHTEIAEI